jgi:16S rRNA (adenine1518-N6/adenine1519-N6)-dimethyltransferase
VSLSLSQLRAELAARGIRPTKRLGQNFMIDPNLARAVVRASGAADGGVVLEVGAGAGHLTEALLDTGARVVAVELDTGLAAMLRERLAGDGRVRIVEADVLAKGDRLSPVTIDALREELAERRLRSTALLDAPQSHGEAAPTERGESGAASSPAVLTDTFVVASNLPYNIAATFLIALAGSGLPWSGGAVTVQLEVAERLAAAPGSKTYGASSVLWQLMARGRIERVIGREVFWPRPEVDSALFVIEPRADAEGAAADSGFASFVRALFSQRRKVLRGSLAHAAGVSLDETEAVLAAAGIDPASRIERAAPEAVLGLWRAVRG